MVRVVVFTLVTLLFPTLVRAQSVQLWLGVWKLNVGQVVLSGPPPYKRATRRIEPAERGVRIVDDLVRPRGGVVHLEWIGRFDGLDYPVQGAEVVLTNGVSLPGRSHLRARSETRRRGCGNRAADDFARRQDADDRCRRSGSELHDRVRKAAAVSLRMRIRRSNPPKIAVEEPEGVKRHELEVEVYATAVHLAVEDHLLRFRLMEREASPSTSCCCLS